ncbi:hypothetical protein PT974_06059 [Cladobotryum mycophilum]|uniref:BHLH domain-containing protein n=1 Tax=Cladobotryum mycophilum TaxID=491253 RepID=A0ABR0SKS5_9HYPO
MSSPNNNSSSSADGAAAGTSSGAAAAQSSSAGNATTTTSPPGGDEKPRLTEEEKKQNHIASEQKRRQAIREGFDRLTELVPGLEGQGRSEGLVLKRTVEFMREQLKERQALVERIEQAGGDVDPQYKK